MLKSRTPTKAEKQHMDQIIQLGCIVCRETFRKYTPPEVHHLDGKTKPGAHFKTIPLCYWHHRAGINSHEYVSRHPYKAEFEKRYGTELELLEITNRLKGGINGS